MHSKMVCVCVCMFPVGFCAHTYALCMLVYGAICIWLMDVGLFCKLTDGLSLPLSYVCEVKCVCQGLAPFISLCLWALRGCCFSIIGVWKGQSAPDSSRDGRMTMKGKHMYKERRDE